MLHSCEVTLQHGEQRAFGAAPDHPWRETTRLLFSNTSAANSAAASDQRHDLSDAIGLPMARGIGRHVGEHDISGTAQHGLQLVRRCGIEEIDLCKDNAGDFVHLKQVDADNAAAIADALLLRPDLLPPARSGAEIGNFRAGLQEMMCLSSISISLKAARERGSPRAWRVARKGR